MKSAELKKRWQDKGYAKYMAGITKKMSLALWSNPAHRQHISTINKKRWLDPALRKKMSEKSKRQWEDPKYKQYMVECYRNKWATDPSFRGKFIPILKEHGRNAHFYRFLKVVFRTI